MRRDAPWPVAKTFLAAIAAAGIALYVWTVQPGGISQTHPTALLLAGAAGAGAAALGWLLRLGRAWLVLILIAAPALVLVPIFRPPAWVFPLIVVVLAGFYINGVRERVPLYLSNITARRAIADLVPARDGAVFIDLGCGLGGVVQTVASAKPNARVIGVETAPLSFLIAWIRIKLFAPGNAEIRYQNIWSSDISTADTVYAFLSPAPMARLNDKVRAEMKPGSIFVSNSFAVPGLEPDTVLSLDDARGTNLLIWRL